MKTAHNHIIDKVFVEIETNSSEKAFSIKNEVSGFLNNILFPQIEVLLDEVDPGGQLLRIEKCEVSADFPVHSLNQSVAHDLVMKIERGLKDLLNTNRDNVKADGYENEGIIITGNHTIDAQSNKALVILQFLETGRFPWFSGSMKPEEIFSAKSWNELLGNQQFCRKLENLITENKICLQRFIRQVPLVNVIAFIKLVAPEFDDVDALLQLVQSRLAAKEQSQLLFTVLHFVLTNKNSEKRHSQLFEFLLALEKLAGKYQSHGKSLGETNPVELLQAEFEQFVTAMNLKSTNDLIKPTLIKNELLKTSEVDEFKEKDREETINKTIYIDNAGLVLLHPFLKTFFITTGIADPSGKIENRNLDLAVQALHFIATGRESVYESGLVFEKFLCGVPFGYPIIRDSLLTPEIKAEVDEMLKQVIKQWAALKNSTPAGLREAFLQRSGILQKNDKGYKLTVEAKTFDILLDKLPWGFGIINWYLIDKLIFVEWQL